MTPPCRASSPPQRVTERAWSPAMRSTRLVTASRDKSLQEKVNSFSMITPDGQPVRWALNVLHGAKLSDRVYGPELMRPVCQAADEFISIYLYGGTSEVLARLERNLSARPPGPHIAGSEAPPFQALTDEENEEACRRISQSGARIVMVGLGCPKQDLFTAHHYDRIDGIQMCLGAATALAALSGHQRHFLYEGRVGDHQAPVSSAAKECIGRT